MAKNSPNSGPEPTPKSVDGEFVVMEAVPFFKEHTNRDGVRIDRVALQRICNRCNERISDTGDYPPVVLTHTDDEGEKDPEVVGFAGPFFLGTVGHLKPKVAILGTMRIFAEDADRVKKYPRLSVEYWASEDDPTNGYFDPVSLLGATTPELDLGIRYSHGQEGRRPMRYSKVERFQAALPGGSNTCLAGGTNMEHEKKTQHAKEFAHMALDPSDILQITDAMKVVSQAQVDELKAELVDMINAKMGDHGEQEPSCPTDVPADEPTDEPTGEPADEPALDENKQNYETEADVEADLRDEIDADESMTQYAKIPEAERQSRYEKLANDHHELRTRYQQIEGELRATRAESRKAVRYQKLSELAHQGMMLDVAEEFADTEQLDDAAFSRHLVNIVTKYQRIPNYVIPIEGAVSYTGKPADQKQKEKSDKYAKQAGENVLKAREKGVAIEYRDELARLIAEDNKGT